MNIDKKNEFMNKVIKNTKYLRPELPSVITHCFNTVSHAGIWLSLMVDFTTSSYYTLYIFKQYFFVSIKT